MEWGEWVCVCQKGNCKTCGLRTSKQWPSMERAHTRVHPDWPARLRMTRVQDCIRQLLCFLTEARGLHASHLQDFPLRPGNALAMTDQFCAPCFATRSLSFSSSCSAVCERDEIAGRVSGQQQWWLTPRRASSFLHASVWQVACAGSLFAALVTDHACPKLCTHASPGLHFCNLNAVIKHSISL